jgi:hypothetical protein
MLFAYFKDIAGVFSIYRLKYKRNNYQNFINIYHFQLKFSYLVNRQNSSRKMYVD